MKTSRKTQLQPHQFSNKDRREQILKRPPVHKSKVQERKLQIFISNKEEITDKKHQKIRVQVISWRKIFLRQETKWIITKFIQIWHIMIQSTKTSHMEQPYIKHTMIRISIRRSLLRWVSKSLWQGACRRYLKKMLLKRQRGQASDSTSQLRDLNPISYHSRHQSSRTEEVPESHLWLELTTTHRDQLQPIESMMSHLKRSQWYRDSLTYLSNW